MATYSTIKGFTVQSLATDPAATKGSWASGGALNTPRSQTAGLGTPTAAMSASGNTPSATRDFSETYDGTTWTEGNNLNTARRAAKGAGSTTAGLVVGGLSPPGGVITATETYDGTSWSTSPASLTRAGGTAQFAIAGASSTSALIFGGEPGTTYDAYSETWNGTAWTEGNNLNTGRSQLAGAGIVTAALGAGGYPDSAKIESYDGTSWTEIAADLGTARYKLGGSGTSTASLVYGGQTSGTSHYTKTESYNGSTWTEVADLATANYGMGNAQAPTNTNTLALAIAGYAPSFSTITEEWSIAPSIAQEGQVWYNSTSSVLKGFGKQGTGAWASGTVLNTGRSDASAAGTTTASLVIGGVTEGEVESYDGSTWTELGDLNTDRGSAASGGIQTAAMIAGGGDPDTAKAEQFDGTSWTEITAMTTAEKASGAGTTTSLIAFAKGPPPSATNESWNGTSWTEVADMNTIRYYASGVGASNTDALCVGGQTTTPYPAAYVANVEQWNGTSWTALNPLNSGRSTLGTAGTTSGALAYGGGSPASALTEQFDGTSWTEVADLATARYGVSLNCSTQSAFEAFCTGGQPIPATGTATEEWTVPDATKTFTAS